MNTEIKSKLIETKVFIDNKYLDEYCKLIEKNINTKKEKFKTNEHHILPKNYYKLHNIPVDNSKDNIVNLLYRDHVLAHYYLAKCCVETRFKYSMINAIEHILGLSIKNKNPINIEYLDLDDYQELYEFKCSQHSKIMKGRYSGDNNPAKKPGVGLKISIAKKGHIVTDETKHKISLKVSGRVQSKEERLKRSKSLKGKNSGEKNGMFGSTPWNKGMVWIHQGSNKPIFIKKEYLDIYLNKGYSLGMKEKHV